MEGPGGGAVSSGSTTARWPGWHDRCSLALALLCLLDLLALLPGLVPRDLNLAYGFMDGDSYDWIANGLRLAGADVRYSGRSPLLPLVIALLDRLSALRLLPLLLHGLFLITVLVFYKLAARLVPRRAAFAAALALLVCFSLGNLSLQVMADVPASCLLLFAVRSFLLAGEDRRRYLTGGLWAALAALTQSAGVLWVPAAAATVLIHRRRDLRSPWLWAGLLAPPALMLLGAAIQPPAVNGAGGMARDQWSLVVLHFGSAPFYLYSLASLLGLPGALLMLAGGVLTPRAALRNAGRCLTLVLLASLALFFVFLYDFQAKRFVVYGVWLGGLLIAEALARPRHRMAFGAAALLLVSCAALPLPTPGNWPAWAAVWPVPPLYLEAPAGATAETGSSTLDLRAARLSRLSVAAALAASNPALAWRDAARPFSPVDEPRRFAADRSAIYLYADLQDGGGRYRTLTRLGSALRKRVKVMPAAYFEPYWPLLTLEPAGSMSADYELFHVRLPGLSGSWLLAVDGRGPLHQRLAELAGRGAPAVAFSGRLARGRDTAEAIRRFVAGDGGFMALIPYRRRADLSQLYLPFVLPATELFVLDVDEGRQLLARLAGAPVTAEARLGSATVRKTVYLGRKTSVISYLPPG